MEFSLFDIFGILQKVEFISRLLAKINLVDFITILVILGTLYSKIGAGSKKLESSFKDNFKEFETKSESRFANLATDLNTKIKDLKENNDKRILNQQITIIPLIIF